MITASVIYQVIRPAQIPSQALESLNKATKGTENNPAIINQGIVKVSAKTNDIAKARIQLTVLGVKVP